VLVGVAAAGAGLVLLTSPATVTVTRSPAGYDIGGTRLAPAGPGAYRGPGGAALVITSAGGATRAGSSAVMNGEHVTGQCVMPDGASGETCRFTIAGRPLAATDTWRNGGWRRQYDDGRVAEIQVAGGRPVPVPFPVGR
jgi:hypothetical protein